MPIGEKYLPLQVSLTLSFLLFLSILPALSSPLHINEPRSPPHQEPMAKVMKRILYYRKFLRRGFLRCAWGVVPGQTRWRDLRFFCRRWHCTKIYPTSLWTRGGAQNGSYGTKQTQKRTKINSTVDLRASPSWAFFREVSALAGGALLWLVSHLACLYFEILSTWRHSLSLSVYLSTFVVFSLLERI